MDLAFIGLYTFIWHFNGEFCNLMTFSAVQWREKCIYLTQYHKSNHKFVSVGFTINATYNILGP